MHRSYCAQVVSTDVAYIRCILKAPRPWRQRSDVLPALRCVQEVEARVEEDRDFMHRPAPFSSREDAVRTHARLTRYERYHSLQSAHSQYSDLG